MKINEVSEREKIKYFIDKGDTQTAAELAFKMIEAKKEKIKIFNFAFKLDML